jgi:hypothetical protein
MSLPCVACAKDQSVYLTSRHLAQLLGVKAESLANMCQAGQVPGAYKGPDGRTWLVGLEDGVRFLNQKRVERSRRNGR